MLPQELFKKYLGYEHFNVMLLQEYFIKLLRSEHLTKLLRTNTSLKIYWANTLPKCWCRNSLFQSCGRNTSEFLGEEHFTGLLLQGHFIELFLQEHFREQLRQEYFTEILLQEHFTEMLLQEHFTQSYQEPTVRNVEASYQQHITHSNCTHSELTVSPAQSRTSKRGVLNTKLAEAISISPLCSKPITPSYCFVLLTGNPQDSTGVTFNLTNWKTILEKIKFIDIIQMQMNGHIDTSPNQTPRRAELLIIAVCSLKPSCPDSLHLSSFIYRNQLCPVNIMYQLQDA